MELRQLRYFCAVVDCGNFTRAAAACAVAQPSLSQQILNLESELGQPLLVRHPRRVELTEAGASILEHARRILGETDSMRRRLDQRTRLLEGRVTVGAIPTVAPFLLPGPVAAFVAAHPGVRVRVRENKTSVLMEELVGGQVEFAIAGDITIADRRRWSMHVRELFRERLWLAMAQHHALAQRTQPVSIEEIPGDQLIVLSDGHCLRDQTLRVCRLRRAEDRLECEQLETLLAMVGEGLGIGIIPAMATRLALPRGVVTRPILAAEAERTISIVRRRSTELGPAAAELLKSFRAAGPGESQSPHAQIGKQA
jgi:LysR family transcriptional regulator, hydrogen peroxide-inducible genes activator